MDGSEEDKMKVFLYISTVILALATGLILDEIGFLEGEKRREYIRRYLPNLVIAFFMFIVNGILLFKS